MKTIFIFLLFYFVSPDLFANTILRPIVIRDENFNAVIRQISLPNLISDNSYDGKYFKIVYGKSDEAISFDDTDEIQLKAATTYYHLNKARQFFTDVIKSDYVKGLPPLIIRLDLINVFNEVGHFANDHLNPQFNNALSIPAGAGYPPKNIHPWGNEIWFRPSKKIQLPPDIAGIVKNGLSNF